MVKLSEKPYSGRPRLLLVGGGFCFSLSTMRGWSFGGRLELLPPFCANKPNGSISPISAAIKSNLTCFMFPDRLLAYFFVFKERRRACVLGFSNLGARPELLDARLAQKVCCRDLCCVRRAILSPVGCRRLRFCASFSHCLALRRTISCRVSPAHSHTNCPYIVAVVVCPQRYRVFPRALDQQVN